MQPLLLLLQLHLQNHMIMQDHLLPHMPIFLHHIPQFCHLTPIMPHLVLTAMLSPHLHQALTRCLLILSLPFQCLLCLQLFHLVPVLLTHLPWFLGHSCPLICHLHQQYHLTPVKTRTKELGNTLYLHRPYTQHHHHVSCSCHLYFLKCMQMSSLFI